MTGVEHFGGFIGSLHGYPETALYQLPPDCHP